LKKDHDRRRPSEVETELGWAVVVVVLETTTELLS
jgi:hypothetical protein